MTITIDGTRSEHPPSPPVAPAVATTMTVELRGPRGITIGTIRPAIIGGEPWPPDVIRHEGLLYVTDTACPIVGGSDGPRHVYRQVRAVVLDEVRS